MIKGIGDLSSEISRALSEYTTEVTEGLEEAKVEVAKETVKQLKENSPKKTGRYAKGWTRKKVGSSQVVHNKTSYQLTHLLENGHVIRSGGRTKKYTHIAPAEAKAIEGYLQKVEKVIKG